MKRFGLMVACLMVLAGCEKPEPETAPEYEYHTIITYGTDTDDVNAMLAQGWEVDDTKLHEKKEGSGLPMTVYALKRKKPSECRGDTPQKRRKPLAERCRAGRPPPYTSRLPVTA